MTKEEAVEGIKRHLEAILSLAKEIGTEDYLSAAIVEGCIQCFNCRKDDLRIDLYFSDGEWSSLIG